MTQPILVAGLGNLFLRDDGFGPEVVRRLVADGPVPEDVRVVDYGIRGLHLAYDLLEGFEALVIADAVPHGRAPGEVTVLEISSEDLDADDFDAHGMNPVATLGTYKHLGGTLPTTYVVGCLPESTEEGIGLSASVDAAIPDAIAEIRALLAALRSAPEPTSSGRR